MWNTLYLNVSYIASFHFSNTFDIGHKKEKQYKSSINFFFQVVDVIGKVISCWDSLKQCAPPTRAIAANCSVMGFTPEKQFQLIAVGNKLEINPNNFQSSVCNMQSRIVCHCRNTKKILSTEYHPFSTKIVKLILWTKTIHFLCWLVLRNLESYQAHLIDNFLQSRYLSALKVYE